MSEAKWCTVGALYQPVEFCIYSPLMHTHTHSLPPSWIMFSVDTYTLASKFFFFFSFCFRYASVLPLGQQPSAKPISKCCLHHPTFVAILMSGHVNFLFLGRFKVKMLKVKPAELTGGDLGTLFPGAAGSCEHCASHLSLHSTVV